LNGIPATARLNSAATTAVEVTRAAKILTPVKKLEKSLRQEYTDFTLSTSPLTVPDEPSGLSFISGGCMPLKFFSQGFYESRGNPRGISCWA